jgi:hypothetical protein
MTHIEMLKKSCRLKHPGYLVVVLDVESLVDPIDSTVPTPFYCF